MRWKVFLPYLILTSLQHFQQATFPWPHSFCVSSISSGCSFCLLSDTLISLHLLMLVFPGTLYWVRFSSHSVHTWGWVWHIPVASTDTCQQPTLQKYSVSSLVLSFLSQTCNCHHPLDINGSWMPAGTSNSVYPKEDLWHRNQGQSGSISSLGTPGTGSLSSSTQLWVAHSLLAQPLYMCLEPLRRDLVSKWSLHFLSCA